MSKTGVPTAVHGRAMNPRWVVGGGMLGLALGYFLWYTPYAAGVKALSGGLFSGVSKPANGLVMLPAVALGTLVGAPLYLAMTGWWRYIGTREVLGRMRRFPSRTMIVASFFTALLIGTTTLNYAFAGISILFILIMMRAGVMILSPIVDLVRRRVVRPYSWAGLGLSLLAAVIALSDVTNYRLTIAAVLSLATYFIGYIGRFRIMSRVAKTGDEQIDRRYFAEEAISSAIWLAGLCGIFALIGVGPWMQALRDGFTSYLFTSGAALAFAVGLLYAALYVYGTLIYLDAREYTWCVPANRVSSVFAALASSYLLTWGFGVAPPGPFVLISAGVLVVAIAALSYPVWSTLLRRARTSAPLAVPLATPLATPLAAAIPAQARLLFVCGTSTDRSPMAAAIARAELNGTDSWLVDAAGLDVTEPGKPMSPQATDALRQLNITACQHRTQPLTRELCDQSTLIYTMTAAQRDALLALAPTAAGKTHCLDPAGADLPSPHHQAADFYHQLARRIQTHVRQRLTELPALSPTAG
jgi:protein-tyrosine-phosphatase